MAGRLYEALYNDWLRKERSRALTHKPPDLGVSLEHPKVWHARLQSLGKEESADAATRRALAQVAGAQYEQLIQDRAAVESELTGLTWRNATVARVAELQAQLQAFDYVLALYSDDLLHPPDAPTNGLVERAEMIRDKQAECAELQAEQGQLAAELDRLEAEGAEQVSNELAHRFDLCLYRLAYAQECLRLADGALKFTKREEKPPRTSFRSIKQMEEEREDIRAHIHERAQHPHGI